jgi:hypothetical protein
MDVQELTQKWTGWEFDEVSFEITADSISEFALACGETLPRYVDPQAPDFQAVPSFSAKFHGGRQLPEGFPMDRAQSFDGGKCVEHHAPIHAGDSITARSTIHNIFEKTGRSGGMLFVVHRMRFTNQRDELVAIVDWKMIQKLG